MKWLIPLRNGDDMLSEYITDVSEDVKVVYYAIWHLVFGISSITSGNREDQSELLLISFHNVWNSTHRNTALQDDILQNSVLGVDYEWYCAQESHKDDPEPDFFIPESRG